MQPRLRGDSWYLRKVIDGKRKDIPLGVYGGEKNRKRAETVARQMSAQLDEEQAAKRALRKHGLDLATNGAATEQTFADWWAEYEKTYLPGKAKRTQARDRQTMAQWLPPLGAMKLADIRQKDVLAVMNTRRASQTANPLHKTRRPLSEASVQRERRLLQAIFERAIENSLITSNPFKGIKAEADKARNRLLSADAEKTIIKAMQTPRKDAVGRMVRMDERWARFLRFLLETGLRLEECRGIDPKRDIINGHVRVTGKFRKVRDVPLTATAAKLLKDQLKADGCLWPQNPQRLREVLSTAADRAKLTDPETGEAMTLSPHDCRHTFGWRWLQRGGDIYTLSKILGHASVSVTEKHYAALLKDDLAAAMRKVMG